MRRHRDQIDVLGLGDADAARSPGPPSPDGCASTNPLLGQLLPHLFEVGAVLFHLLGLAQRQLVVVARDPAVGDVHQQQRRAAQLRELLHVREDRAIGVGVLDGDQDVLIHRSVL